MSDSDEHKPQAPKPSRLAGLIAPKGAAARPTDTPPTPSEPAQPAPVTREPIPRPALASPPPAGTGSKSLTLRLHDAEYERLRARAYASRMTHQAILAEALRRYLDEAENA